MSPHGTPEEPYAEDHDTNKRWLELHGQKRRVTVAVPEALKPVLGTVEPRAA